MKFLNAFSLALTMIVLSPAASARMCSFEPPTISGKTSQASDGQTLYSLTVAKVSTLPGCPAAALDKFYLPYFSDSGLTALSAPTGWGFKIALDDRSFASIGLDSGSIEFFATSQAYDVAAGQTLSGFSFESPFGAMTAPVGYEGGSNYPSFIIALRSPYQQTSRSDLGPLIPASVQAIEALNPLPNTDTPPNTTVPEPSAMALLSIGCIGLLASIGDRRRRGAA